MNATISLEKLTERNFANELVKKSGVVAVRNAIAELNANLIHEESAIFAERFSAELKDYIADVEDILNSKQKLIDDIASKYSEEQMKLLGVKMDQEVKKADLNDITVAVNGEKVKFAYFDANNQPKITASTKRKPNVIQKAIDEGKEDNFNVLKSNEACVTLGKYLVANGVELDSIEINFAYNTTPSEVTDKPVKKRKPYAKTAPKYVFTENGVIRTWTGKGIAPLPLKEARHLSKNGFPEALQAFEIQHSEENKALFAEFTKLQSTIETETEKDLNVAC